jgi:S1-C subfamily serine protease
MRILALAIVLFASPAFAWELGAMNRQIDATNFLVNKSCSATMIGPGELLTAAHCVVEQYRTVEKETVDKDGKVKKEKYQIAQPGDVSQLEFSGSFVAKTTTYTYKIAAIDRALDLALLKTDAAIPGRRAAEIECNDVVRGDTIYAVGNSYGVLYSTVTRGIVSSVTRSYRDLQIAGQLGDTTDNGEHGLVQHSAPIAGGNSGGALYNDSGHIVGVNVRGTSSGGFSFAVPLSDVRSFLKEHDFAAECH